MENNRKAEIWRAFNKKGESKIFVKSDTKLLYMSKNPNPESIVGDAQFLCEPGMPYDCPDSVEMRVRTSEGKTSIYFESFTDMLDFHAAMRDFIRLYANDVGMPENEYIDVIYPVKG